MLRAAQREIDEGRGDVRPKPKLGFDQWVDEYMAILEDKVRRGDRKPRTLDGYRQTLERARVAFGAARLGEIGRRDLRRFDTATGLRPASRLRYLRELSACLQAAVDEGKLETNPVPAFTESLDLKKPKRGGAPFEIDELPRLYAELAKDDDQVYLFAARFSAEAGLRLGELIGLEWTDVSLLDRPTVTVTRQYHDGLTPKSGKVRRFRLTRQAAEVLAEWIKVAGAHGAGPVFPMKAQVLQRRVEAAREAAGIPKLSPDPRMVDEQGKPLRRSFHSFRYSCAALMLHRGYGIEAVMATTGHSRDELAEMYGLQSEAMLDARYDAVETPTP